MKSIKLYVMRSGIITDMPRELLIKTGAPVDYNDLVSIPVQSYLIDHPKGIVLYDTGHSRVERYFKPAKPGDMPAWLVPEEDELPNQLARLGIAPKDVKYVVCSHLHIDHGGYLELFKKARVIVHSAEFAYVAKLYSEDQLAYPFVKADFEEWMKAGLKWHLLGPKQEDFYLLKGIKILNFGSGHSYGMLGLLIELPRTGNIIIISDAIYCRENAGPPVRVAGFSVDDDGYINTANHIMQLAECHHAQVWYGHDMKQFEGLIKMDEGYYE